MSIPESDNKINPSSKYEEIDLDEVRAHYKGNNDEKTQISGVTFWNENKKNLLTIGIIILVGTGSYGLGTLSRIEREREQVKIIKGVTQESDTANIPISPVLTPVSKVSNSLNSASVAGGFNKIEANMLVGSISGTKYHFPWCSGAQRIKNENKVWFSTPQEARKAGYTPAANCKGLK